MASSISHAVVRHRPSCRQRLLGREFAARFALVPLVAPLHSARLRIFLKKIRSDSYPSNSLRFRCLSISSTYLPENIQKNVVFCVDPVCTTCHGGRPTLQPNMKIHKIHKSEKLRSSSSEVGATSSRVVKRLEAASTLKAPLAITCLLATGLLTPTLGAQEISQNIESDTAAPLPLPIGKTGIASNYPGDRNIQNDPRVLFTDNFESYTTSSQLGSKWNDWSGPATTRISTEPGRVYSGLRALEFTLPQSTRERTDAVKKTIYPERDVLFARAYTKFDATYNVPGSNHNGIRISAHYPGPGQTPNGTNFFLFLLQNNMRAGSPAPGYSELYVYHPDQGSKWGDLWLPTGQILPTGTGPAYFGTNFLPRPNFVPVRNRWYCYELMVKANTPGQRNGRAAFWIDGRLIADFTNLRMRDINTLKIDNVQFVLHAKTCPRVTRKWYDNIVVAKSYIGPLE